MKLFLLKFPILFGFIVAACGTQDSVDLASTDSSSSFEEKPAMVLHFHPEPLAFLTDFRGLVDLAFKTE